MALDTRAPSAQAVGGPPAPWGTDVLKGKAALTKDSSGESWSRPWRVLSTLRMWWFNLPALAQGKNEVRQSPLNNTGFTPFPTY